MTSPPLDELRGRLQTSLGEGYQVLEPLGAGGFAVVYLVQDLRLKRRLAVKVLSPDIAARSALERLRREAETVAQLSHPNIVPLHFIGGDDDLLYLVMSCIDGGSLADRLKREPQIPIDDARRLLTEVAGALGHAHKRGVVHRDIKPQNVLLDLESGRALVTDFGIARTAESISLTASGILLGTPAYVAPEQVTGEPSDHRADIYSLGVMAYEMVAGRPPFDAPTPTAVLMKRLAGPPEPITTHRPDVPADLERAIHGCLAQLPDERFQSAADVVRALTGQTPTSGGHRTSQTTLTRKRNSRMIWVGAAGLVAAAAVAFVAFQGRSPSREQASIAPVDSGMVLIPAGDYVIGSDSGPVNSQPAHTVALGAFGIDRHEVTVGEFKTYVDSVGVPAPWRGGNPPIDLPVTRVTFSEATNYCRWKHPDGGRLPTELEWEAAARGKEGRGTPWGSGDAANRANVASVKRNVPAAVGTFVSGATPDGIVDLIGNVWEWTSSPMRAYPGGAQIPDFMAQFRIIRGGAYNTLDNVATVWFRAPYSPTATPDELPATGFRCAMSSRAPVAPSP